jgi:zinc resistance-associated protein
MKKTLILSAVALTALGGAYAFAQQGPRPDGPPRGGPMEMHRMSPEDRAAFMDGRIAAARATLKLTPEQDKLWPPVESALRDLSKTREAAMAEREKTRDVAKDAKPDPMARLRSVAQNETQRAAALTKLADAATPLYASLDEAQKRRVERFLPGHGPRGGMMGEHHGRMGDGPRGMMGPDGEGPRGSGRF